MGAVTPVDGFLCTDGQFFPTKEEAQAHQHSLDLTEEIKRFIEPGERFSMTGYAEVSAIIRWEEHKKLKELKQ